MRAMYRILVADDEKSIREGLKHFVQRNFKEFEVYAAENGQQALEMSRRLLPDVILTDINMPHMDGLEYLETVKESLPDTILLVVSGYETFEYALACIHLGVREYFLKPIDTRKLKQVLEQISGELDKMRSRWQREEEETPATRQTGEALSRILERENEKRGIVPKGIYYLIDSRGNMDCRQLYQRLRSGFYQEGEVYLIRQEQRDCILAMEFHPERKGTSALVLRGLTAVHNYCKSTGSWEVHFIISRPAENERQIRQAWEELKNIKDMVFPDASEPVLFCNDIQERRSHSCIAPPDRLIPEIRKAVRERNQGEIRQSCRTLKEWLLSLEIVDASFAKTLIDSVCSQALFGREENFSTESYGLLLETKEKIIRQTSFQGLMELLEQFLCQISQQAEKHREREQSLSRRIDPIIEERMDQADLSFETIAGELYFTPNYLRSLFKKETGMTFVEYLTEKRMERARLLLQKGEMKINAVASAVGYNDSKYFSLIFKRINGMSPTEYQNIYGKGEVKG